jgi:hypothetical protein
MIVRAVCKDIKLSLSFGEFKPSSTNCVALLWEKVNILVLEVLSRSFQSLFTKNMVGLVLWMLNELKFLWFHFLYACFIYMKNVSID